MLEPWFPASLASSAHRTVQVRIGFDLEPTLPDPAPAFADPDGSLHPALLEGLAALPLQSYPTPGARSALVCQVLSEPGRPDFTDPEDPFLAIYRHAVKQDMEPEVTGNLALLLIRGLLAQEQRQHRPQLPDPEEALLNPNNDPWQHRRARLHSTDWNSLWDEVVAADAQCRDGTDFAFERINIKAARKWLQFYRLWWSVGELLASSELCPEDPEQLYQLEQQLQYFRQGCAKELGSDTSLSSASLLDLAIRHGERAEQRFIEATGSRPSDGPVNARWLLNQQLRSLRHISLANREHFLALHQLLRETDTARVLVQLGYRVALLDLWLADQRGEQTNELEDRLIAIEGPEHQTTLGAALGRVLGAVLVRRLRRGDEAGALPLAERALRLAPEELAVRMAWNDLRYQHRAGWDRDLLSSLRAEYDRWEGLPVLIMGSRVAVELGDERRGRWFREHLINRAINSLGFGPWAVLVKESLSAPQGANRRRLLEELEEEADELQIVPDAATWALFGSADEKLLKDTWADLKRAVSELLADLDAAENLVPAQVSPSGKKIQLPAWRQLVAKKLPPPDTDGFPAATWARVQSLRAAAPELRRPPLAGRIRELQELLSRAADLREQLAIDADTDSSQVPVLSETKIASELSAGCTALTELMATLSGYLDKPGPTAAETAADWLEQQMDPLRVALREPRALSLTAELDRLIALARAAERQDLTADGARLRAEVAHARTSGAAEGHFDAIDAGLNLLREALFRAKNIPSGKASQQGDSDGTMSLHPDFERFSREELGILPEALRRALEMVRLFNLSGGRRDRKRLKGKRARDLFELRHRTAHTGGLRVFYQRTGRGWQALAAMSKYDDRQQRDAIDRIQRQFQQD